MPGTLQVTVLEFKGVSSSGKPSAKSVKVSMGKTNYQTWDKGDFLFPVTKLREDIVLSLLDAGGNEIAHTDVRTMRIIEKGSWDEVFSINGRGHIHLKLRFVLNDDERKRIREMRQSAMKKKKELEKQAKPIVDASEISRRHEANLSEVDSSSTGFFSDSAASFNPIQNHIEAEDGGRDSVAASSVPTEVKPQIPPKKLGVARNVKKMISAFETNQLQETKKEVKTMKKAQSTPSLSQLKKLRLEQVDGEAVDNPIMKPKEGRTQAVHLNHSNAPKAKAVSISRENYANISPSSSLVDNKMQSYSETASRSGIMIEEEQERRQITGLKSSTSEINHNAKISECYREGYYCTWIFPGNQMRPLCITSAGKQVPILLRDAENVRPKELEKTEDHDDNTVSEGGASDGLIGQVIKVAAIFGFGLLVLFTRQREPARVKEQKKTISSLSH